MARAPLLYPLPLHHLRWAKNGSVPDFNFQAGLVDGLNHVLAYRRKVIFTVGHDLGPDSDIGPSDTTTTYWRARCQTGYAATRLRFKLICGRAFREGEFPDDDDPVVRITVVGGGTTTYDLHYGAQIGEDQPDDAPEDLLATKIDIDVNPATTYEIAIAGVDAGRPLGVCVAEYADPEVDATDYFAQIRAGVRRPITFADRAALAEGLVQTWRRAGAQLVTWAGNGLGTARSITGTTWTNIIDGSSTSVGAATPGYRFDAVGGGAGGLSTLLPLERLRNSNDLQVTIAAYANASASGGEVRLVDSGGVGPALTGINTTLQWYSNGATWSDVDAIASGKVDLQARHSTGGQTVNVYAVSIYCPFA